MKTPLLDDAATHAPRVYRGMDREALSQAYDNTGAVTDSPRWLQTWRQRSETVRARHARHLDLAYGEGERQKVDYFACGVADAPLFVFLHGGYWQRNSRDMFSFVAEGPMARGFDVAVVGYTLAPEAGLGQIVDECAWAIDFLLDRASTMGLQFDARRVIVGGWSAGGHLATMMLTRHPRLHAVLAISGIFDLEPIILCNLNDKLNLRAGEARLLSPLYQMSASQSTMCIAYGEKELPELQRQSVAYGDAARSIGAPISVMVLPECHHFSILDSFYLPDGELVSRLEALASADRT